MYFIMEEEQKIGTVKAEKRGLYLFFDARCKPMDTGKYHLYLAADHERLDLGLCVPEEDSLVLRTSMPAKRVPKSNIRFYVEDVSGNAHYIPVNIHEPFPCVDKLKAARLVKENGQLYITLT